MSIAENLNLVRGRIQTACQKVGVDKDSITLVAVSKTFSDEKIFSAIDAGQYVFGENYIPEGSDKAEIVKAQRTDARFHFIGSLQRNKVRTVVKSFDLIHSIDRIELALEVDKEARRISKKMPILIQVNISDEESKSGCRPKLLQSLAEKIAGLENLSLLGIMSIGSAMQLDLKSSKNVKLICSEFSEMAELKKDLENVLGKPLKELSMGMSSDFDLAIEFGATIVRVGSAIFGTREIRTSN